MQKKIIRVTCDRCYKEFDTPGKPFFALTHFQGNNVPMYLKEDFDFCSPECLRDHIQHNYPFKAEIVDKEEEQAFRKEIAELCKQFVIDNDGLDPNEICIGRKQFALAGKHHPKCQLVNTIMGMRLVVRYEDNDDIVEDHLDVAYTEFSKVFLEHETRLNKVKESMQNET